ncbi:MAG: cupin domain-containing protein [Gammaproteobacteria bacterium]|uniref:cupin domain-containing protein n=1 Tax=Pseudomaricurvus alcaniphilus TaxID=1166482 RepID=UPI001409A8AB|nr:cupin domain-containing protein [Pseudomaricurvus alcaniphilus]MBR9909184.1 cupin domain-containing protein [Gammaproteobacteria bacterium]NHN38187.1 cupin domain-containing protein [Pseudomaricurvus alcaniphilus]
MQTDAFLSGKDLPFEYVAEGVKRQLMGYNNQIMMVKVYFEEGSEGYVHSHFHSQVAYVESGEFDVTVGDETRTLVAGDCFFMEPNISHGAICKKAGVLIDVFSPMREDFLGENQG